MIPITKVDVTDSEPLVLEVLRSGNLAQGAMVKRLEDSFAQLHGVEHCIAVNNGTTALVAALEVCNLKPGDEVITSPFTFIATLNAILESGATAHFVDIGEDFCIDPSMIQSSLNERTAVLLPVHLYGQSADMEKICTIASDHNLLIVEDAAQAHGAAFDHQFVGGFGMGCFSLYATKNITSGEGGLITTNDAALAEQLRILRNQGMRERYQYVVPGHNYRMTDVHAAIAIPQVAKVHEIGNKRAENANYLTSGLSSIKGIKTPQTCERRKHVWHQYTILLTDETSIDRDLFISKMNKLGISCGSYYPKLVFDYDCFRDHPRIKIGNVANAQSIASRCVSLPVHQFLTREDLDLIIEACHKVFVN
jgi:dTDP-4-amino-4,6-dideoxygalactose transaminase